MSGPECRRELLPTGFPDAEQLDPHRFAFAKEIGRGLTANVYLCYYPSAVGDITFVCKLMRKKRVMAKEQVVNVMRERACANGV